MKEYFEFNANNRAAFHKKITAEKTETHVVIGEEIFVDVNREKNETNGNTNIAGSNKRFFPQVERPE